ncbi:MAG TPA: ABC transporter ATP-binding protein [Pseudomonadales bacterium]|nr:ABC transporter ATP-binding protein [Pseudomonadales bacterium]
MAGLLISRVFEAMIPLYLRDAIDRVGAALEAPAAAAAEVALLGPALAILACVLARYAFIVASRQVIRRIGVAVAYDLRKRTYAHLQRMGPAFYAQHPTGDLMARAVNDIQLVRQLIGMGLRTIVVLVFSGLTGLAFMVSLDPVLTLTLLPPLPVIGLCGWWLSRRVFAQSVSVQAGFSHLSERVQENLGGIRTVQAQVQEAREIDRFAVVNDDYAQRFQDLTRTNSVIASLMPWLGSFCLLSIIGFGGARVLAGDLSVGTLTAFLWYLSMVLWPVRQAGQMVTLWQQGASGAQRIFEVLDALPEVDEPDAPRTEPPAPRGHLELRSLAWRYPGARKDALARLDIDIPAGSLIAVTGPVGAGKTTLLRLLVRLLDPPPGSALLDGLDVRAYGLAELRRRIVLVPQDPFLFADLLRANLSYDDPARSDERIGAAAAHADLTTTIARMPGGLATLVGERGVTLSGGQKQRATLTRGMVQDAAVLLLDDSFSSVDTETEARILDGLRSLRRGRTTVLVTHRVATARIADRILVLDDGQLLEQGTHAELMAANGAYATLERMQRGGPDAPAPDDGAATAEPAS